MEKYSGIFYHIKLLHVSLHNCTLPLSIPALIMALKYMAIVLMNTLAD